MIVKNKEKFLKKLFIYKHLRFIKYETNIKDKHLQTIIDILNIKNPYKRKREIIEKSCDYIDNYYKEINPCQFKNSKCICHRIKELDNTNGCCKKCKFQSNKGCTTKNIACKLFFCSYADLKNTEKIKLKEVPYIKLLNPVEKYIVSYDFFRNVDGVLFDLFLWPALVIILFVVQLLVAVI